MIFDVVLYTFKNAIIQTQGESAKFVIAVQSKPVNDDYCLSFQKTNNFSLVQYTVIKKFGVYPVPGLGREIR